MSALDDRVYLRTQQYRDAGNLTARIHLHERFGTNRYGWHRWVFDRLDLPAAARVLEVGCGPGSLWAENRERLPAGWKVVLSDFSPGMIVEARRTLQADFTRGGFVVADAAAIPFPEGLFDAVVASFVLHHVPDRETALSEIRRVLRPGGRLLAATSGRAHMRELNGLLHEVNPEDPGGFSQTSFTLENGLAQMRRWFVDVTVARYDDALFVTEVEPLLAYVLSGRPGRRLEGERRRRFVDAVASVIGAHGGMRITKDAGMFVGLRAGES